jgi:glutamate-5-semialdehyde dehydrogenase
VLPEIGRVYAAKGVEMRGDDATRALVPSARQASEQDYGTEWLAPVVSIRVVKGLDEAIEHIAKYGSQHTTRSSPRTRSAHSASCARWIRARSW